MLKKNNLKHSTITGFGIDYIDNLVKVELYVNSTTNASGNIDQILSYTYMLYYYDTVLMK